VSFLPGVLRAAGATEERSFRRRGNIVFLVPFVGALVV
jgi:hypothetical protein